MSSWLGNQSGNYMPLDFTVVQNAGTIGRSIEPPHMRDSSEYDIDFAQSPPTTSGFTQSPPSTFGTPHGQTSNFNHSSPILQGGDYFQSPRPESFQSGYSNMKDDDQKQTFNPQEHKPWIQFLRLLGTGFARFLLSAALIIGLWKIIWTYSTFSILDQGQKRFFNFLVTAFSLALGLNLATSLKSFAIKCRWWILSWEKRPLEDVEAILGCHALTEVIKLGCKSVFKNPSVTIGCSLWLLINLATQAFVASLGLNYSLESAVDSSSSVPGSVIYTNMTQFYFLDGADSVSADQLTANEYGDLAINYNKQTNHDVQDRVPIVQPLTLYSATNYTDYWDFDTYSQYVFLDFPADATSSVGPFYSNRSITTEASCTSQAELVILEPNNTVTMPGYGSLELDSVYYYVTPNPDGTAESCGPRCTIVYAVENNRTNGFSYICNVTVSNVVNASPTFWAQEVSDNIATIAAESIAVAGYGGSDASSESQYFMYYKDVLWGSYGSGDPNWRAYLLRIHAIGAIVGADKYNNVVPDGMPGLMPNQGVQLKLDHPEFIAAILGGIGGFHFVLFILAAWLANKVVVVDDSCLAIALLMRPVVDRLNHGSLMSGKEICKALKHPKVSYGTVDKNTLTAKIKHLEISERSRRPSNWWRDWYD